MRRGDALNADLPAECRGDVVDRGEAGTFYVQALG